MRLAHGLGTRMDWIVAGCLCLVFSLLVGGATLAGLAARATGPVLVVFPPWLDLGDTFERVAEAGGQVVGIGARSWIVLVAGPSEAIRTGLSRQGALLLLDPGKAALPCGLTARPSPE